VSRRAQDSRDVVVLSHETRADVARGDIDLNNLPSGRVDVLARCASAALFVSHGVRACVRVWLMLRDVRLTLCVDGAAARGLHPDERTLGSAIRRALRAHAGRDSCTMPAGWSVLADDAVELRLRQLTRPASSQRVTGECETADDATVRPGKAGFIVLHELGASVTPLLLSEARGSAPTTVLVLGDHQGFDAEEEACFEKLGGVRASVSHVPLLASHCIVLVHAALDAAWFACQQPR
jgi:tRNA (pseudouridine54-N1)-methyltransferase